MLLQQLEYVDIFFCLGIQVIKSRANFLDKKTNCKNSMVRKNNFFKMDRYF